MNITDIFRLEHKIPPAFETFFLNDRNPLSGHSKKRIISNPNASMRLVHGRFMRYLRSLRVHLASSTGCRRGNSALKNLLRHSKHRYFYALDLRNAYGSVKVEQLVAMLCTIDPTNDAGIVTEFALRFLINPTGAGLVVGAPVSPDVFNLYGEFYLDRALREIAARYSLTYTRYLDDLTFSSDLPIGKEKRREIRAVIGNASFGISDRKSQVLDIRKGPIVINGIGLTLKRKTFLPRKHLIRLRGLLHRAITIGNVKPALIHGHMGMFLHLTGKPLYMNRTERKLLEQYDKFQKLERIRNPRVFRYKMPRMAQVSHPF
jgi:hypothetical protein